MSDTPESVGALYWESGSYRRDMDDRSMIAALERYAELLERLSAPVPKSEREILVAEVAALKARVEELERQICPWCAAVEGEQR